jgi:hypothetical protein
MFCQVVNSVVWRVEVLEATHQMRITAEPSRRCEPWSQNNGQPRRSSSAPSAALGELLPVAPHDRRRAPARRAYPAMFVAASLVR